ncbi:15-hydroxyprostaglandin dehydrogenase [NAD(+)]-like [Babylonia areolata]|uniref:15-hydroxyprostaglandin dehydrogenase [NAD(+)]-like n=1 Tax=Babylonia areolata TaxID=304850 RepID=UPI003FD44A85
MSVKGQVALITGAAQGLGKGFASILLQHGAKVALTDVQEDVGKETLAEFQKAYSPDDVIFIKVDVTSEADMEHAFRKTKETFKRLDIVVNNAGIGGEGDNMWEKCVDINLKGPIRGTRLALNYMRKDRGGQGGVIINVSSAGGLRPQPEGPVYCGTKSGVMMFSRSIAADRENEKQGVRVNTLCPAFVDTPLVAALASGANVTDADSAKQKLAAVGIMTVEEVAEAFFDLVKDPSRNGAVLAMSKHLGRNFLRFEGDPPPQSPPPAPAPAPSADSS